MFKRFLLRIFLVCSTPLLLVLLWDIAHANSAEPNSVGESGEIANVANGDSSHQVLLQPLAKDAEGAEGETIADSTQPSAPPLLSDVEIPEATSAVLLPAPETQHPRPNTLAQTADDLPEVEFTPGGTLRITVTGTRTPRAVDDLPATVTVFELDDIEFNQVQDLRDLLRYEPGVSTRNDLRFGLQDVNIRGIEGNRILFQIDGIRLPERFQFGQFNLGRGDYVDFNTLQAVEVLRGPASTLYGSDALGGVVSFRSLRPDDLLTPGDTFAGQLRPSYTSQDGGFNTAIRLAGRQGDLEGVVVVSRQDARETSVRAASEFINPQTRDGTTVFGNLVYWLDDNSHLSLIGETLNRSSRTNRNTAIPDSSTAFVGGVVDEVEDIDTNRWRVGLSYEYDDAFSDSWLQFARAQIFYQDSRIGEAITRNIVQAGNPFTRRDNNSFDSEILGGDVQLRSDFTTGSLEHQLTYGLDVSNTFNSRLRDGLQTNLTTGISTNIIGPNAFPVKDFPDGDTLRIGAYLQDEIRFGDLEIIAGLRFDYYNLSLRNDEIFSRSGAEGADFSSTSLSPRLALLYTITPGLSVYGQYARGFRAPLYSEISSGFTNTTSPFFKYRTISNPDLEPETSNSYEIGVRGRFEQFNFRLTGFYNTYNNFIETLQPAGTERLTPPFVGTPVVNLFQSQNISNARIYGVELAGEYRFNPNPHGFSLTAALGFAQGDDLTTNQPLHSVDPVQGVVGLRYQAPDNLWRVDLVSTFVGAPRVPRGTTTLVPAAYALFDLIGAYNITPNLGLNLGVYNLLNTQYFVYNDVRTVPAAVPDIDRFSQPGTNVRVGVSYAF